MTWIKKSFKLGEKEITFEVGRFAQQANASVLASCGGTMVLSTVVSAAPRENLGYFPLSVEYVERLYAGGRIKGSRWVKREGRPSDEAILKARLIDRSIRPLFPANYKNEVQVIVTILSVDGENEPDLLGLLATSAAFSISDIPWNGPIAGIHVGYVPSRNGEKEYFLINPTTQESNFSEADCLFVGTESKMVMIEVGAKQIEERIFLQALDVAYKEIQKPIEIIDKLVKEVGKKKQSYVKDEISEALIKKIDKDYGTRISSFLPKRASLEGEDLTLLSSEIEEKYEKKFSKKEIEEVLEYLFKKKINEDILKKNKRIDGRGVKDIREINIEVGVLPRTHGSAMFQRGETQVLTVVTLGSPLMEQLIESPEGEETKRYIHHYNMPPYSVGEVGRLGWPSRREVGHGALAEKALEAVIPVEEKFPYTIRVVTEVMSSNGSTSMAAVCGSTLALMDAGVPILAPVAGVALGLMEDEKKQVILSDIIGLEDFAGSMDFKIAGTRKGITAIQLDVKNNGLTRNIIEEALNRAKEGRKYILDKIDIILSAPRSVLSQYAPKIAVLQVPQDKIGEIIGPGGKVIRQLIAQTGASIDVDDNGRVTITGTDKAMVDNTALKIKSLTHSVKPGELFEGEVKRIVPFGTFVEILPGKEGLVHVSQMSKEFVQDPGTIVSLGQKVKVKVLEIDSQGRVDLTMVLDGSKPRQREKEFRKPRWQGSQRSRNY